MCRARLNWSRGRWAGNRHTTVDAGGTLIISNTLSQIDQPLYAHHAGIGSWTGNGNVLATEVLSSASPAR